MVDLCITLVTISNMFGPIRSSKSVERRLCQSKDLKTTIYRINSSHHSRLLVIRVLRDVPSVRHVM